MPLDRPSIHIYLSSRDIGDDVQINLFQLTGNPVLAGSQPGQQLLAQLFRATSKEPKAPEALFLDFGQIEVATASYLRESVLKFRDIVRRERSNFYPTLANANDIVLEEFSELLRTRGGVFLCCKLDSNARPKDIHLIGELDPKQEFTFECLTKLGEADANLLMERNREGENVQKTAWNNRLAALTESGLVVELKHGKSKRYRPLFQGVE